MAEATTKTAVVFRPKRNWKPKKRERNPSLRKKRKAWWRKNKYRLKLKRKKRRRLLQHNSLFKQWRKKRVREKQKRRMRFASEKEQKTDLPQSWFVFRDDAGDDGRSFDIDMGYVVDYDPDQEDLLIYDVDEDRQKVVNIDDFLTHSEFLEDADIDNFELIMDQYYGGPEDDLDLVPEEEQAPRMEFEVGMEELAGKVASEWVLKRIRSTI